MDIGCCIGVEELPALEAAGADYCELSVARAVMGSDEEFAALVETLSGSSLPPRAYNVLLPGDLLVVGPTVDRERIAQYLQTACERVQRLGGRVIVFGSGRSRAIPDGFSREEALDQLEEFVRQAVRTAGEHGITIAIEPLRRAESNVFNSVRECAAFVRERRIEGARVLADLYHMMEEDEPLEAIDEAADLLAHTHIADSGREPPGTGSYDITGFFRHLRENGYAGDCSIECRWSDFPSQIGPALAASRAAASAAGW